MADNFIASPGSGGDTFRADDIAGVKIPSSKINLGADGTDDGFVSSANPLPTTGKVQNAAGTVVNPATSSDITNVVNAVLSTLSVAAAGTFPVSGPLTDTQLRATAVPVSGTIAVSGTVPVSAASLPLPTGAATAAKQPALGTAGTPSADVISVQGVSGGVAQPVSGTVALGAGAAAIGTVSVTNASGASAVNIQDGGNSITVDGTVAISGSVAVTGPLTDTQLRATAIPVSSTTLATVAKQPALGTAGTPSTDVITVQGAATGTPLPTKETRSGTATLANVAGSASSVTLLASNTARLGATIQNDSSASLYVKFGTTASVTSYTVLLVANAYYEVPFAYTGRIDGIWASATGNARVTELT